MRGSARSARAQRGPNDSLGVRGDGARPRARHPWLRWSLLGCGLRPPTRMRRQPLGPRWATGFLGAVCCSPADGAAAFRVRPPVGSGAVRGSVVMGHARVLATRGPAGGCWGAACARQPVCAENRWVPAGPPVSTTCPSRLHDPCQRLRCTPQVGWSAWPWWLVAGGSVPARSMGHLARLPPSAGMRRLLGRPRPPPS